MSIHMQKAHYVAAATVLAITALGSAAEAAPGITPEVTSVTSPVHTLHVVKAGQSIQKAVNAAKTGDTVVVRAGTYRESVRITVPGVTLRGAAGRKTVISPAAKAQGACATAGHGICVTGTAAHRVTDVKIRSLTVTGFKKDGIHAVRTDRMDVRRVTARANGQQGISQERSIRGILRDNTSRDNGESGIFLANMTNAEGGALDTQGAVINDNRLTGNRIGVTVRRARHLTVERNTVTGNCGGVFIVGDESIPRAGDLTVSHNRVDANNKFCKATTRLPAIQGAGIVLTGAEDTTVTNNRVRDNKGTTPMSGGIVLFKSVVGAPNDRNTIRDNTVERNGPADLADRDAGTGNVFTGNRCQLSEPTGRCGP